MKKFAAYIRYYVWNVFCSFAIFLPITYVLNILTHLIESMRDDNYVIRAAISEQLRVNYRIKTNIQLDIKER